MLAYCVVCMKFDTRRLRLKLRLRLSAKAVPAVVHSIFDEACQQQAHMPQVQARNPCITSGCSSHRIVVLQVPPVERLYRYFWRRKGDVYALLWDMQR